MNCAADTVPLFHHLAHQELDRAAGAFGAPAGGFNGLAVGLRAARSAHGSPLGAFDAHFGTLPAPLSVLRS